MVEFHADRCSRPSAAAAAHPVDAEAWTNAVEPNGIRSSRVSRHIRNTASVLLAIRQHCKRYARLTQAFSKKLENHIYAFALHTMYHNFVKISGAHKMSPAQAAGVDSRLWEIEDMVAMVEAWEASSE